jgi:PAS domain S-box-containing protein
MNTKILPGLVVNQALEIIEFLGATGPYLEFAPGKPDLNLRSVLRAVLRAQVLQAITAAAQTGQAKIRGLKYLVDSEAQQVDVDVQREDSAGGDVRYRILFKQVDRSPRRAPRTAMEHERAPASNSEIDKLKRDLATTREAVAALMAGEEDQQRAAQREAAGKQKFQKLAAELELANAELEATAEELRAALVQTKESEARLRESEERFAHFMENLPGLAWIKDLQGRYVYVNQSAERAFEIPRPSLYGKTDAQLFPAETAQLFRDNDQRAVASGEGIQTVESLQQQDGIHQSIVSKFPIRGSDGAPALIGGVAFDITAWKLAEQSMRESEARFRTFATNAPAAIFIKDLEGRYTLANPLACQVLARPDVVGLTDLELLPAGDAAMLQRHDREVISTGRALESEEVVRGRYFLSVKFPLLDHRGQAVGVCGVGVDITDRKQAAEDLRESEQRLRLALDAGQMGTWEWLLETNQVVWSPGVEAIHGLRPGTFTGSFEAYSHDIHPDDYDNVRNSITRVLETGEDYHVEYRIIWPDGSVHWVEASGKLIHNAAGAPVRMTGICADVTGRKLAEAAIRESEQKFRLMADAAPVLIWISGADKHCTWFNRQWLEFVGRGLEQEVGDGWTENVHPDDFQRCLSTYVDAFDKREHFEMEYRLRRHDGEYRWVLDHGVPLYESERKFIGYIGSCLDITERRQAEQSLLEADRRKDEFLAMLGHELRNPLAAISTGASLLQSNPSPERRRWVEEMLTRQANQLQRLVDDLLDVSRISRGKIELRKERVLLQPILKTSVAAVDGLMSQRGHQLSLSAPSQEIWLEADPARLQQVLVNLLTNAAKYTPDGGTVWLSAELLEQQVIIRCRDTGVGLSAENLDSIFEPFVQFGPQKGERGTGLGMGLTLARNLAELHGGSIQVSSAGPGQGSEFALRLPALASTEPLWAAADRRDPLSTLAQSFRILVVDDNRDLAESLALFLRGDGHEVSVAHDGETAIPIASRQRPEIVLLDIGLPGIDGYAVAERLRSSPHLRHAIIVAMSGRGRIEQGTPFDACLVKPIEHRHLIALLQNSMAGSKGA